jgi:hypothetical protein
MYICKWCCKSSDDINFLVESDVDWSLCSICSDSKDTIIDYLSFFICFFGSDRTIPKCLWNGVKKYFPVDSLDTTEFVLYRGLQGVKLDDVEYNRKKVQCWTTNKAYADSFAGLDGIVLELKIKKSDPKILFWNSPLYANEMLEASVSYKKGSDTDRIRMKKRNNYGENIIILSY